MQRSARSVQTSQRRYLVTSYHANRPFATEPRPRRHNDAIWRFHIKQAVNHGTATSTSHGHYLTVSYHTTEPRPRRHNDAIWRFHIMHQAVIHKAATLTSQRRYLTVSYYATGRSPQSHELDVTTTLFDGFICIRPLTTKSRPQRHNDAIWPLHIMHQAVRHRAATSTS